MVLALSTVVRPTSAAAVMAMLATRHPQRLLVAYIVAGLTFSLAVGTLVVVVFPGIDAASAFPADRPVVEVVLGALSLGYGTAVGMGWLPRRRPAGPPDKQSWMRRRLQDLSPRGAATAGVLTHLPGLVYLAALNAIVGSMTGTLDGVVQVAIYNAIWFSMAVIALILSLYRPSVPRDLLDELSSWTGRHRRSIIVVSFGALGGYLVVAGVVGLVHLSGEERPTQGHGQSVDAGALPPAFAQPLGPPGAAVTRCTRPPPTVDDCTILDRHPPADLIQSR
jgi:hypothetical protein